MLVTLRFVTLRFVTLNINYHDDILALCKLRSVEITMCRTAYDLAFFEGRSVF